MLWSSGMSVLSRMQGHAARGKSATGSTASASRFVPSGSASEGSAAGVAPRPALMLNLATVSLRNAADSSAVPTFHGHHHRLKVVAAHAT